MLCDARVPPTGACQPRAPRARTRASRCAAAGASRAAPHRGAPPSSGPAPAVRLLTPSCDPAVTRRALDTLGEGFCEDPALPLLGIPEWRSRSFFRFFGVYLDLWPRDRVLYVAGDGDAVAIVAESHKVKAADFGPLDLLRCGFLTEMLLMPWSSLGPLFRGLAQLENSHEALEPHGVSDPYLKVIALTTHPDARGRGYASQIMDEITRRADEEGRDLFLEAAPTGIDAYYRDRHGFETVETMRMVLARGGCYVPLMLRRARRGDSAAATAAAGGGGGGVRAA